MAVLLLTHRSATGEFRCVSSKLVVLSTTGHEDPLSSLVEYIRVILCLSAVVLTESRLNNVPLYVRFTSVIFYFIFHSRSRIRYGFRALLRMWATSKSVGRHGDVVVPCGDIRSECDKANCSPTPTLTPLTGVVRHQYSRVLASSSSSGFPAQHAPLSICVWFGRPSMSATGHFAMPMRMEVEWKILGRRRTR